METVKQLNKQEFTTKVADIEKSKGEWKFLGERPAVIDFFATWCGPCKALAPVLNELAADYQYKDRIDFYKVDIDQEQELAAVFGKRQHRGDGKEDHKRADNLDAADDDRRSPEERPEANYRRGSDG
jgi:hypothetical protein